MSDDDRQSSGRDPARPRSRHELLRDLESIRELLDAPADIPVLREVVPPSAGGDEKSPETDAGEDHGSAEVQFDLFDARRFADRLLDATWQEESEAILASARRSAEALTSRLSTEEAAAARSRLQERIAEELPPLLEQVIGEAIDELQERLLRVLRSELGRLIETSFATPDTPHIRHD